MIRRTGELTDTVRLYYESAYIKEFRAKVLSCSKSEKAWITVLDRSAFYPEGGGQPCDTGVLLLQYKTLTAVTDVREKDGLLLHYCDSYIEPGTAVTGRIDWKRRFDHMQQHSGEHIVSGMICKYFECDNVGFHMGREFVTIDYNADIDMGKLREIEAAANRYIWENHAMVELHSEGSDKDLPEFRSKKEISGDIRIISFPGADTCACCGTHVSFSAEVGLVKFISCRRFTKGSRIELLCGKRAFDYLSMNMEQNGAVAAAMAASPDRTAAVYEKQRAELIADKLRIGELEKKYNDAVTERFKGSEDVLLFEDNASMDSIRRLCVTLAEGCSGVCAVFSGTGDNYRYAVSDGTSDDNSLIKRMNERLNGRGGGKGSFGQGSVNASRAEIEAFFSSIRKQNGDAK